MSDALTELLTHKKALETLLSLRGEESLEAYAKTLQNPTTHSDRLHAILEKHAGEELPKHVLHTADHMGLLNHSFFWGFKAILEQPIVLATSNISPSNSSFPRGLQWHDETLSEKRSSFLHLSERRFAFYGEPALDQKSFQVFADRLPTPLSKLFIEIISEPTLYKKKWLSEQLCNMNEQWWQELFGESKKLHYLELEAVVNELLLEDITNPSSAVSRLFFDKSTRESFIEAFTGVIGAHAGDLSHGSHIFWYLDHKTRVRHSLHIKDDRLVSDTGHGIKLTPDSIAEGLRNRTLLPTLALSYCLLVCEHNATLAGGFSQIDYLPAMIEAWSQVFSKSSTSEDAIFSGEIGLVGIANNETRLLATLVDLYLRTDSIDERNKLIDKLKNTTLKQAVEAMSPLLLKIVTGEDKPLAAPIPELLHA